MNAPSPAATASLAIGDWIAREVEQAERGDANPTDAIDPSAD